MKQQWLLQTDIEQGEKLGSMCCLKDPYAQPICIPPNRHTQKGALPYCGFRLTCARLKSRYVTVRGNIAKA
jgi:hypothetical protein